MGQFKTGRTAGFVGNMQPSTGNIELRAVSCGVDILTLMQGTTAGKFLVCRKNTSALSTVGTSDLAAFSSVGSWTGGLPGLNVSDTTVDGWTTGGDNNAVDLGTTGNGQMYLINGMSSATTITLPTPSAGGRIVFAENQNTGKLVFKPATTGTFVTGGSKSGDSGTFGATGATIGYGMEFFTDGSYWYAWAFPPSGAKTSTLVASTLAGLVVSS